MEVKSNCGAVIKSYFQSQTKVEAIIKNGTSLSASLEKLRLLCGDKDLGLKLYVLYMFILNLICIYINIYY